MILILFFPHPCDHVVGVRRGWISRSFRLNSSRLSSMHRATMEVSTPAANANKTSGMSGAGYSVTNTVCICVCAPAAAWDSISVSEARAGPNVEGALGGGGAAGVGGGAAMAISAAAKAASAVIEAVPSVVVSPPSHNNEFASMGVGEACVLADVDGIAKLPG